MRGRWFDILLNVLEPSKDKRDATKDPERVFDLFPGIHMNILLRDFFTYLGKKVCLNRQLVVRVNIELLIVTGLES